MGYTKLGEFLRLKRIKNHEVMGDLADYLGVSTAFVSAVETGKRNMPEDWKEKIIKKYDLNEYEVEEFEEAINESKIQVKINLVGLTSTKRHLAIEFQRSFDSIDDDKIEELLKILGK